MIGLLFVAVLAGSGAVPINPAAVELFDRDPVLSAWAINEFDGNGDGWLTTFEAQGAAAKFKELADGNRDGRVTVREFEEAKTFIVARTGQGGPKIVEVR